VGERTVLARREAPARERVGALASALREAREYTLRLYARLSPAQRDFPRLAIVNPPGWELGHVGWFQEFWCRRWSRDDPAGARTPARLPQADAWFDSRHVPHDVRWDLPLPDWEAIHAYLSATLADTLEALPAMTQDALDRVELALRHEDMHGEAMLMALQALALPAPPESAEAAVRGRPWPDEDDAEVAAGRVRIGTPEASDAYAFDNERGAHDVVLRPFAIARAPVRAAAFAAFVDDGGYREPRWWTAEGRAWLADTGRDHPAWWSRGTRTGAWEQRVFDRWQPLVGEAPVLGVNAHEAEAWCRWAGRRLPMEAEWECAARTDAIPLQSGAWEWTASAFQPYPGFVPGLYAEYSAPWFGDHRVVRGGSWATRRRLASPAFRNFYRPQRHDPFVGFRTCATARRAGADRRRAP
jgi:iron(II)-dependent oxidoreductase